jgi:hypothetical protein
MEIDSMSKSNKIFPATWIALPLFTLLAAGCNKTVDDATLTKNVQSALASDSTISQQPVQVAVQSGVVTLTGNLSDETASSVAAQDTAKVRGVKEVVNDITVAGLAVPPTITTPSAPSVPRVATPQERAAIRQHQALPPPPENAPAPPAPSYREVTIQPGYDLPVRITESLDSETTQPGTPFSGVVTRNIVVDGYVAIPAGASVRGTVTDSKDATHFKGSSLLSLRLDSVRRHGDTITVNSDPYVLEGKGRGTNTAEKIGGGAAIGAVLGGIFGGGKGAAIGAGAGAGGGAAIQGFTRGQQVHVSSETVIRFRLESPITVRTAEIAGSEEPSEGLQQHP